MTTQSTVRYLALVVDKTTGYAVDYYPEEERVFRQALGKQIIGDFATVEQANAAIAARLTGKAKRRRASEGTQS
jgi:hypothetical protein